MGRLVNNRLLHNAYGDVRPPAQYEEQHYRQLAAPQDHRSGRARPPLKSDREDGLDVAHCPGGEAAMGRAPTPPACASNFSRRAGEPGDRLRAEVEIDVQPDGCR